MITRKVFLDAQRRARAMIEAAGIRITEKEARAIEVADFGLGDLAREGAQILTFFSTDRISAKVIALFPGQTVPEHWHPPVGDNPGKEETVRVVHGTVHFYTHGEKTAQGRAAVPAGKGACYEARCEHILAPGDQITLAPGTKHWFQAGEEGAVLYSFSTCARDALDRFTDPRVVRATVIAKEE